MGGLKLLTNGLLKNVNPIATQQYLDKANHFFEGMNLLAEDIPAYRAGVGLLAIHSAISLNDAIVVGIKGARPKYEDHMRAVIELKKVCSLKQIADKNGIEHLAWLLAKKDRVAYSTDTLNDDTAKRAVDKAQRFARWAYNQFKGILRVQAGA